MTVPNHFSSPMLSNWQSAVAKVATSPATHNDGNPFSNVLNRLPLRFDDAFVSAAAYAAHAFGLGGAGQTVPPPSNDFERCAKVALNLAVCRFQNDEEGVRAAQAQIARFGECDPRWAECIAEFVSHYALTKHGDVPYRRWRSLNDFVMPADALPAKCRIGIIGDWGTGDARAQAVLDRLAAHDIQILVHVGDIYYSCTTLEANTFHENVVKGLGGRRDVQVYSLCGNHDMYSGGAPYYALLDRIRQPASFFGLRNDHWQVLGADTGYNDFDPFQKGGVASWIQDFDDRESPYSELLWHQDKFRTAGGRRSIFLTHHQPFSRNSAIDGTSAVNERLLGQLGPYLKQVDLWIWGHEHNQVVYAPFRGFARGRCVGGSAIPVPGGDDLYRVEPSIVGDAPKVADGVGQLTVDGGIDLYNLGYAILDLDGPSCTESYYELNTTTKSERLLFTSTF